MLCVAELHFTPVSAQVVMTVRVCSDPILPSSLVDASGWTDVGVAKPRTSGGLVVWESPSDTLCCAFQVKQGC